MENRLSLKTARMIGSFYFLLLGVINLVATSIFAEIHALDLITAAICTLPVLINNKMFLTMFGLVAGLISFYLFFAGLSFSLEPNTQTSKVAFAMGFLFIGSAFAASVLLIYSGKAERKTDVPALA